MNELSIIPLMVGSFLIGCVFGTIVIRVVFILTMRELEKRKLSQFNSSCNDDCPVREPQQCAECDGPNKL